MSRQSFACMLIGSAALLAACAAPARYAGIDLQHDGAPSDIQQLAARAQAGDKSAQLELGIRYEEGRGVPTDRDRAINLYSLAARDDARPKWVYSPAVGSAPAAVTPLPGGGTKFPGLAEAQQRLVRLKDLTGSQR